VYLICLQTEIYSLYGVDVCTVYIIKCSKIQKNIFSMNFHPKSNGFCVTLSVKKVSVTFVTCVRVKASHYDDLSQNFGSLGGWVISILTLQMI